MSTTASVLGEEVARGEDEAASLRAMIPLQLATISDLELELDAQRALLRTLHRRTEVEHGVQLM